MNSSMSSIFLFMLFFLEAPKGVLESLNSSRAKMVWQESSDRRKYHLVNWPTVCMPKSCGGLGVCMLHLQMDFYRLKLRTEV